MAASLYGFTFIDGSRGRRKRRPVARGAVSAYNAPNKFDTPDGVFGRLG